MTASIEGQRVVVKVEGVKSVIIRLNDEMLSLDKQVTIELNGRVAFQGTPRRTAATFEKTMREREDPRLMFGAEIEVR